MDIDFIGDDDSPSEFDRAIIQAAKELKIFIEPVPIERFIPLPAGSDRRKIRIGTYGNMEVLERMTQVVLTRAREFDIDPADFLAHLDIVRERLM
ncbi:MAG: hypothetical protein HYZ24_14725 [Chloroflexi bacterium]|nr:hypothetical protein [Chloroflexota bacterium]